MAQKHYVPKDDGPNRGSGALGGSVKMKRAARGLADNPRARAAREREAKKRGYFPVAELEDE